MIQSNNMTEVEFAGKTRGHFLMARGVRQGCPASSFLFGMAFDPIFRWLHDSVIPRDPPAQDFLQPAPCAYADDFAVAASSFRSLMTALSPSASILTIGSVVGYSTATTAVKNYWSGSEQTSRSVRYAKYVGTMIGPEGYLHRWTAPR